MRRILPIIVISQFFCTSLWFAGNSIVSDLVAALGLANSFLAHLTSAIQFGFIAGTLVFAIFTISDRFSPSRVFFLSAVLAGLFNLGITLANIGSSEILIFRFLTGFFLAGIYPVGMKIASDYYQASLGKSLGFLVGALVLGTAFPHLIKSVALDFPWKYVVYATTALSLMGGLCILLFVPDGPYRKPSQKFDIKACMAGFSKPDFRSAAVGYFGHMWELYAFWAFVPLMLAAYQDFYPDANLNVPLLSFLIIGSGAIACVFSGILSLRFGAKQVATAALLLSCICCLLSPFFLFAESVLELLIFLFIWGLAVIADSPLFSTLVAQSGPEESRGTALTLVNSIGFSITIISIQTINLFTHIISPQYIYLILAIGPILGLAQLWRRR
ncbi:MFS transporter [Cytophagales bacterium LB-30]|uniref:MFS transporter n=1 Tax=Shiella aurantiaca TaxID=3058365 RepID=A0ABT8F5Z1_9BACT|nr:MFS transporter [Shiella aurantiaca]MDN4165689.1 MFS transporter [Shiella aurantiaca]